MEDGSLRILYSSELGAVMLEHGHHGSSRIVVMGLNLEILLNRA